MKLMATHGASAHIAATHAAATHAAMTHTVMTHAVLHQSLLHNLPHINSTVSMIHPSLHIPSNFVIAPITHGTLETWLTSCGLTIETVVSTIIVNPVIMGLGLAEGFVFAGGITPVVGILIAITFGKILPKICLITTGQINVLYALNLFGWVTDVNINLTKNIIDDVKSDIRDYSIVMNCINNPDGSILHPDGKVLLDEKSIIKKMKIILELCREIDETQNLNMDINIFINNDDDPEEKVSNMMINFLDTVDDFLINDLGEIYRIPISKLHAIYSGLADFIIFKELKENKKHHEKNRSILEKNIMTDIIEKLLTKVCVFGFAGELISIFGSFGSAIGDFLLGSKAALIPIVIGDMNYFASTMTDNILENEGNILENEGNTLENEGNILENEDNRKNISDLTSSIAIKVIKNNDNFEYASDLLKNDSPKEPLDIIELRTKIKEQLHLPQQ